LISAAFYLVQDWVLAARCVSLLFGAATLIPLYLLLRQIFDVRVSSLATLVFALTPVFVGRSADVVREPVYWFFAVAGLYGFVRQATAKNDLWLLVSSLSFLMATWARIEGLLFWSLSGLFLLTMPRPGRLRSVFVFASPVILLGLCGLGGLVVFQVPLDRLFRFSEVAAKLSGPWDQYRHLRESLQTLAREWRNQPTGFFLPEARNNIWLIALGTLLNRSIEAFFLPFFLLFGLGLRGLRPKITGDRRIRYLALLAGAALVLLYVHILHTWVIDYRFMALFILPAFFITGFGLERVIAFVHARTGWRTSAAMAVVVILALVTALPKNLQTRDPDKVVFKRIGEFIARREGAQRVVRVATSYHTQRWVSFYANVTYPGAPCPEASEENCWEFFVQNYPQLVLFLTRQNIRYFLWVEKDWPIDKFDFMAAPHQRDFRELGRWQHRDTGEMVLFELI
jgi:4-amino-4-deoxy-L-arabinose transferase-like glycosyltransferase